MSTVSAQRLLQQEIRALPDDLTVEVLDFVQFLKARRAEDRFLWEQVEETRDYRQQHPDEIWTVSADDFLAATADAEDLT